MFSLKNILIFIALIVASLAAVALWKFFEWPQKYAVKNVSIVDVERGEIVEGRTVFIKGGKIVSIVNADAKIPGSMKIIDGQSKFLAPGLTDSHVHITDRAEPPLYVSYGVTTVRNMWGERPHLLMRRFGTLMGIVSPRLITSGPIIDGEPKIWPGSVEVTSVEQAKSTVREHIDAGYDFIKVYSNLSPALFDAIVEVTDELGVPFAGHVPRAVSIQHAAQAGIASMEHLTGVDRVTIREEFNQTYFAGGKSRAAIGRQLLDGKLAIDEIFDREKALAVGRDLRTAGVAIVPTLIVNKGVYLTAEARQNQLARPELKYVTPGMRRRWSPSTRPNRYTDEEFEGLTALFALRLAQTKALNDAGVRILAGSDSSNPFVFHGSSLHEEMELLVVAGLSPLEAIQAATVNAAELLNETGKWGVVDEGATADLVLLSANPLESISNYRAIEGVMLRGIWYDADALDLMRAKAAEAFASRGKKNAIDQLEDARGGFHGDHSHCAFKELHNVN